MTATPYQPHSRPVESADALRARIPGWGVDLDPADRPSYPKLDVRPGLTDAHWEVPDPQPELRARERSIEHATLTPVFGTAQPLNGVPGVLRRLSYRRFSEARAAHWLILVAADRVEATEAHLRSLVSLRPDNPITQTGIRAELSHHGLSSRRGRKDVRHHVLDPVIVAGPWLVALVAGRAAVKAVRARRRAG